MPGVCNQAKRGSNPRCLPQAFFCVLVWLAAADAERRVVIWKWGEGPVHCSSSCCSFCTCFGLSQVNFWSAPVCRILAGYGLQGTIPSPSGWQLPATLTVFAVSNNSIQGSIPSGWQLPAGLQGE